MSKAPAAGIPSIEAWTRAAAKSAPDGDVSRLNWVTPEGLTVKPLYTKADVEGLPYADTLPGFVHPTPKALLAEGVNDRLLIYCTTNGTVALAKAQGAAHVYAAALLNGRAVVEHIVAQHPDSTVLIVCSGSADNFNLEDFYGAGYLVSLFRHRAASADCRNFRPGMVGDIDDDGIVLRLLAVPGHHQFEVIDAGHAQLPAVRRLQRIEVFIGVRQQGRALVR